MPRAKMTPGRLYSGEILALQRILRFATTDPRVTKTERTMVAADVTRLCSILGKAQTREIKGA